MRRRASILTGTVTTGIFIAVGISFLLAGHKLFAGLLFVLALFRGFVVVRAIQADRARE